MDGRKVQRHGERELSGPLILDWQRAIEAGVPTVWSSVRSCAVRAIECASRGDRRARQEAEDLADDFVTADMKSGGRSILAAPPELETGRWMHGVAMVLLMRWRARPDRGLRTLDGIDVAGAKQDFGDEAAVVRSVNDLDLASLTPRQREAVLAHRGAASVHDIARQLGVDPSRARELIDVAVRRLSEAVSGAPRAPAAPSAPADRSWARDAANDPSLASDPELQRMLELFASGLSHREIAAQIDWPAGRPKDPREAVRQRLRRARDRWEGIHPDAVPPSPTER
ncbi:MAG: hypothetical protein HMLKMBBP_00566 [Planctomycetes bacterium]|nr:hypothetical protein [Planctomycetota bacterium]